MFSGSMLVFVEIDGRLILAFGGSVPACIAYTIKACRRGDGLTLDADGFSYNMFGGVKRYRWADCSEIRPSHLKTRSGGRVVFNHPETDRTLWGGTMRLLKQGSGWLPESYDVDAHSLAALMNERRDRVVPCVDQSTSDQASTDVLGSGWREERRHG